MMILFLRKEGLKMPELKILGFENFDEIVAFDKLCFPTDFWKTEDWEDLLKDERSIYYAFTEGEKIIADVFIYNWKGAYDYVKIMNVAVHPDFRGNKFAEKLLDHVTEEMKKEKMLRFCGETRASNKAMQKVFEKCGYVLSKIEENYYNNPDESAYKYILQL